jgi:hypothetical protein
MRPKIPSGAPESEDLFRSRPANMLDPRREPLRLAALIDRAAPDAAFGPLYAETGRPGLPTRLPAGLHLLKHAKGLSTSRSAPSGWRTPTSRPSAARPGSGIASRSTAPR